jgi:hypothetical protein
MLVWFVILFRNREVGMSPYPRLLPSNTGVSAPGEPTHRVVAVHPALDGVIPSLKPFPCAHTCDLPVPPASALDRFGGCPSRVTTPCRFSVASAISDAAELTGMLAARESILVN